MSCPFCAFIRDTAPLPLHWQPYPTYGVVSFVPRHPVTPGHLLFVPMTHVADAAELPEVTGEVMRAAAAYAAEARRPFNLITSAGAEATQTVRHLHIHYVPRAAGDGLALPWTGQPKEGDR